MDIFRILSRGAALKTSKKATADFGGQKEQKKDIKAEVDRETNFFRHRSDARAEDKDRDSEKEQKSGIDGKKDASAKSENNNDSDSEEENEGESEGSVTISTPAEAAAFRRRSHSKVSGHDVPLPIGLFHDLQLRFSMNKHLLRNLLEADFIEPTVVQCEAIPIALHRRDLIACAPTGLGKTVAFLLPMVQLLVEANLSKNPGVRGLVLAPTNELALQIHVQLQQLTRGFKSVTLALLSRQLATRLSDKIVSGEKYSVIVSTPLRLLDMVQGGHLDLSTVEQLVIDEADRMFDRGFVEQTDALLAALSNAKLRTSIFSATIPAKVEELANSIMRDPVRVIVGHKEAASSLIDQKLVFTGSEDGKLLAVRQMIQQGEFKPPVIIFLQSITRAKALFHELVYDRLNVDVIHAERTPAQRDEVIRRFKNGDIWVLITTDVLARGVDFKGVNLVINYDVPQTAQAYVHRIGRTGRGGKPGKAVTFFTKEDTLAVRPVVNVMKQSGCEAGYGSWMEHLSRLSASDRRHLRRSEPERAQISTVPKVVKQKRKRKQEMIEASKRRNGQQ